ncbi:hypothetical protein ACU4GD_21775 [Cupriavidus basilensis]
MVAFLTLVGLATGATEFSPSHVAVALVREVLGAVALGIVVGYVASLLLRGIDSYPVEILITLALATGGAQPGRSGTRVGAAVGGHHGPGDR